MSRSVTVRGKPGVVVWHPTAIRSGQLRAVGQRRLAEPKGPNPCDWHEPAEETLDGLPPGDMAAIRAAIAAGELEEVKPAAQAAKPAVKAPKGDQ